MATILDFQSKRFQLLLIYKSTRHSLLTFESFGLSVQAKKLKTYFEDGGRGAHLIFLIKAILAIVNYKSHRYFLPGFESTGLSVQEKKLKYI